MNRQVRNIANAYVFIIGLVLILLVFITLRVVDVYYNNEAMNILDKRASQLESIYTNYHDAGVKLKNLNDEYVDKSLYMRLEGLNDIVKQTTPDSEDISSEYTSMFGHMKGHKIQLVPSNMYTTYMEENFALITDVMSEGVVYYDSYLHGIHWRIAAKYIEDKGAVFVVAEDISHIDDVRESFMRDIEERIDEHMKREPMDVSIIVISGDGELVYCSEEEEGQCNADGTDMRTGKNIVDIMQDLENGQFEYQIKTEGGFKEYFAFTKVSDQYDAHLLLSMEKKRLSDRFGKRADQFLKIVFVTLIVFTGWTINRFRRILGNDFAMGLPRRNKDSSLF